MDQEQGKADIPSPVLFPFPVSPVSPQPTQVGFGKWAPRQPCCKASHLSGELEGKAGKKGNAEGEERHIATSVLHYCHVLAERGKCTRVQYD